MKQSCLPIGERDANLVLAEQNKGRKYKVTLLPHPPPAPPLYGFELTKSAGKLAKEVYKTGMIIRAALHEPFLSGATDVADKSRTESKFGAICTKYRKMIVVALYQDHYVALPLYTHNGNGLQGKAKPDEFVSIKDHRSREPFTKLSTHKALVTENINTDIHPFSPKCTAHLTYPVSRKYDLPVTPEGNLDKPSIKSLIQLYNDFAPRPSKV